MYKYSYTKVVISYAAIIFAKDAVYLHTIPILHMLVTPSLDTTRPVFVEH